MTVKSSEVLRTKCKPVMQLTLSDILRLHYIQSRERVKLENLDAWHTMRYFMALDSSDPNKYHQIIENM